MVFDTLDKLGITKKKINGITELYLKSKKLMLTTPDDGFKKIHNIINDDLDKYILYFKKIKNDVYEFNFFDK